MKPTLTDTVLKCSGVAWKPHIHYKRNDLPETQEDALSTSSGVLSRTRRCGNWIYFGFRFSRYRANYFLLFAKERVTMIQTALLNIEI